jgi:competence protein ComEC
MTVDARLAIPAGVAWIATAILIGATELSLGTAIVLFLLAGTFAAGAIIRRSGWATIAMLACASAAACAIVIAVLAPGRQPVELRDAADSGRFVTLVVELAETVRPGDEFFEARAVRAELSGEHVSVAVPILVFDGAPADAAGLGTTLTISGKLVATEPGDGASFLFFASSPGEVVAAPPWFLDWANGVRAEFLAASTALPGSGGGLLPGLAIGDESSLDERLDAAMKATSLSHLTAVSGANCAILVGLLLAITAALRVPRSVRVAISIVVLVAFVVLVTPQPSVLRAALMASLVLVSLGSGRPARGLPLLCLAVLGLLLGDPWLARDYGFVLSVLATAGLLVLAGPLTRYLAKVLPIALAAVLAVPLAAQLACQPVLLLLDSSIPTYGVVANLLAAPAAPVATIVGLLACVALPVVPLLGSVLVHIAWVPAAWVAAVAEFFAALPLARLDWPPGLPGVLLLVAVTAIALLAAFSKWRRAASIALVAVALGYCVFAGGARAMAVWGRPDWQFAACNIGQGDAVLVRSAGAIALVDTGPDPALLDECLDDLGIGRVDLLVLTHFDLDHVGGTDAVLGRADRVLVGPTGEPGDEALVSELRSAGALVTEVSDGDVGVLGALRWEVHWPPARLSGIEPGNEASVAMSFLPEGECERGCLSAMFLGDLGERSQSRLAASVAQVDVVKVSHHGSADQSPSLYARLSAALGIIGVGAENDYGHPTRELLELLDAAGTTTVRTDQHGLILVAPGGEPGTITVWTERSGDGGGD